MEYAYDGEKLVSASFNAGSPQTYEYEASGKLLRMVDELGAVAAQFEYDPTTGKALSSRRFSSPGVEIEATVLSYGSGAVTVTQGGTDSVYSTSRDSLNLKSRVTSATIGGAATNYTVGYASSGGHPISFKVGTMNDAYTVDAATLLPSKVNRATGGTETYTWEAGLRKLKTVVDTSAQGTRTKQFDYDAQGNMLSMTVTPGAGSARAWSWTYGTMGKVVSVKVNGSTFISGIQYRPFSNEPVSRTKTFDAEGMPSGIVDAGLTQAVAFDAAGRVSSLTGPGFSMIPSYSAADQLAGVNVGGQTQNFTFNTNLNRLTKKTFAGPVVSTPITSNTNLHSTISDPTPPALSASFAYDARKNMTFNGRVTMSYDLKGNLATAVGGGVSASYAYNAFSQRVKKTVGAVSTHFTYDESGNLAGEYTSSGARQAEHIYLGGLPIGAMFGSGPAQPMRVHADYLGTPRAITNGSAVMWKWESTDPFGANPPSVQTVVYNPRFPGQYYDAETNLHYNHHRTYDPSLGRYVQPDPIGLAGGKNPFNYANQNPLNAVDPEGLSSWPSFGPDGKGFDFSINGRDNPVRQLWEGAKERLTVRGPSYAAGFLNLYVVSFGGAVNLQNGNFYFQFALARAYPRNTFRPGFSAVLGNILDKNVDADRVDRFLNGGGTQASAFILTGNPLIGVGGSFAHAYGGDCAFEYGLGNPGVSVAPVAYGKRSN